MFVSFLFLFFKSFVLYNYLFGWFLLDLFHGFLALNFLVFSINLFHVFDFSFSIVNDFVNVFGSILVEFRLFKHSSDFPVFIFFFFLDYMPHFLSVFDCLKAGVIVTLVIKLFIGWSVLVCVGLRLGLIHRSFFRLLLANFFLLLLFFSRFGIEEWILLDV